MRSGKTSFVVYDTSIYVDNFRTDRFTERIRRSPLIARCSAVVLHELRRGVRTRDEESFVRALEKNSVVVTPTQKHWHESAVLLRVLGTRERFEGIKLAKLAFDVLVALSARGIGAKLITTDRSDFERIQRQLKIDVEYW